MKDSDPSPDTNSDVLRVFQSKQETRAFYNKIAKVYDLLSDHSEQPIRQKGLQMLNPGAGERLLEIGFGTGHCLATLARAVEETGKVYGIDLSEKMHDMATECLTKEGVIDRADLRCGDATKLPFDNDTMDGIFMSFTLELFDTPEIPLVLAECRRVLRPGGRIVVAGLTKEGKPGVVLKAFEWTHQHFPNLMDCRPIHVARAMEAAGFVVEKKTLEHMWVPVEVVRGTKPAPA